MWCLAYERGKLLSVLYNNIHQYQIQQSNNTQKISTTKHVFPGWHWWYSPHNSRCPTFPSRLIFISKPTNLTWSKWVVWWFHVISYLPVMHPESCKYHEERQGPWTGPLEPLLGPPMGDDQIHRSMAWWTPWNSTATYGAKIPWKYPMKMPPMIPSANG